MKRLHTLCWALLVVIVASTVLVSTMANAAPICHWVDKTGRTQVAALVPDQYKTVATCTDSQKYELSPEQRQAAEHGVVEDIARARGEAAKLPATSTSSPHSPEGPVSRSVPKRPVEAVTEATDCPTWWRLYDESTDCFGPYRTTRGATRVEAFDACNVVPSPEPKCGPRRN